MCVEKGTQDGASRDHAAGLRLTPAEARTRRVHHQPAERTFGPTHVQQAGRRVLRYPLQDHRQNGGDLGNVEVTRDL